MWARRSVLYDLIEASDLRRGAAKRRLFSAASGRTLLVAVGTGLDLRHFPAGRVVGVDISLDMLRRASARVSRSPADVSLVGADAERLPFADHVFDTVVTSCTLCSVPRPARALAEIRRVLSPAGRLLLFEHVRSRDPLVGLALDVMTLWSRRGGTSMNRDTVTLVERAGFDIVRLDCVFLDVILAAEAVPRPVFSFSHPSNSSL